MKPDRSRYPHSDDTSPRWLAALKNLGCGLRKHWLLILLGLLLLLKAPLLIAAGANNVASRILVLEWGSTSQQLGFPVCGEKLASSSSGQHTDIALHWHADYDRALVNRGREAWLEGDCSRAQISWEQAHQITPQDPIVAFWLFWLSSADEHALPSGLPTREIAQYARIAGLRAENEGMGDVAIEWYSLSLRLNPSREVSSQLAGVYLQEQRLGEAAAVWQQLAEATSQQDPEHWWALGQAAELAQDWELALQAYGEGVAVAEEPLLFWFWIQQGRVLEHLQQWEQAKEAYAQAMGIRPADVKPYLSTAHLYYHIGNYQEALAWYQYAEIVAPEDFSSLYYQGIMNYLLGDYQATQAKLEQALQQAPDHVGANYYLAQVLHHSGEGRAAAILLARAVELSAEQPWQWAVQLGDWWLELGEREEALQAYRQALAWRPGEESIQMRMRAIEANDRP